MLQLTCMASIPYGIRKDRYYMLISNVCLARISYALEHAEESMIFNLGKKKWVGWGYKLLCL